MLAHESFGISHFFGDVYYDAHDFVEKNKENKDIGVLIMFERSEMSLLKQLFVNTHKKNAERSSRLSVNKPHSLIYQSKILTQKILKKISTRSISYIRTINASIPFNSNQLENEIHTNNILELIKIKKYGYEIVLLITDFIKRYHSLSHKLKNSTSWSQCKELVGVLMRNKNLKEFFNPEKKLFQLGVTKVFFKAAVIEALDIELRKTEDSHAVKIQKNWKMYRNFKKFKIDVKKLRIIKRFLKALVFK